MLKTSCLTVAVLLSLSTAVYSAEPEDETVTPRSLKSLLALPSNATKLDLSKLDIENDEVAEYNKDAISVSRLINQTHHMEEADRLRVDTLLVKTSLLGNSGFSKFVEGFIPLFPSIRFLDLSYDTIEEDKTRVLYALLTKLPSLQYVNIIGNPLVNAVCYDVGNGIQATDKERVIHKVIVSYSPMIDTLPSTEWQQTHREFYKTQPVH